MAYEKEQSLLILLGALISFLGTNFDQTLGVIYLSMILVYYIAVDDNPSIHITLFNSKPNYIMAIAWGLGAYIIFYFGATTIINTIFPQALISNGLQSINLLFIQAALTSSETVKLVAFGILIPIIESMLFFGALPQVYAKMINVSFSSNSFSVGYLIVVLFAAGVFTLFHLTAKGITNQSALMVSFIFGIVSMLLVKIRGQTSDAVALHMINNIHAILYTSTG